jgi:hypothetical protein
MNKIKSYVNRFLQRLKEPVFKKPFWNVGVNSIAPKTEFQFRLLLLLVAILAMGGFSFGMSFFLIWFAFPTITPLIVFAFTFSLFCVRIITYCIKSALE